MKKNITSKNTSLFIKNKKIAIRLNQEGLRLILLGKKDDAINSFKESISLSFNYPDPFFHLANIYIQSNQYSLAEKYYLLAIEINPNNADYYYNLAITKYNTNKPDEALNLYKKCLELDPNNTKALKFLGNIYKDNKEFNLAITNNNYWRSVEPNNPEALFNNALIHIRNGRFDIGWKLYESGLQNNIREPIEGFYRENKEIWNGNSFDGTLLVYGEQGLGDQLVFGTVLPDLLKIQKKVILKVDKRLKNLFQDTFENIKVFGETDTIPTEYYQKFISIGSLCKFYRNHTDSFMNSEFRSYKLNQELPMKFSNQIINLEKLKIGISWKTFATKNQFRRSLSSKFVSKILSSSDSYFINLQYGNVGLETNEINSLSKNKLNTIKGLNLTQDINNVINVIKKCDLIITIDNTIAHLASSLGKSTWILLPYSSDFRWMENISASLWYDNAVLIRQDKNSSWDNVIKIIETAFSEKRL